MCRVFAGVALLVGVASFLPAYEPAPDKAAAQLIDQLGSQDFKIREAAAKAIEALGPEALPALRKAKDHPDLEVRRRIKEWIPKFEIEAFVSPKRVNLDANNQPLEKIVAELARQTGYKLELVAAGDARARKPITLRLTKATFWEALDKVCQEGALELSSGPGIPEKLMLTFEDTTSPYRVYQGAFRLRARGFHYLQQTSLSREIDFTQLPRKAVGRDQKKDHKESSESLSFHFDLVAEPRLTVLYLGEPSVIQALDDQKGSLIPKKEAEDERFGGRDRFFRLQRMRHRMFMGYEQPATVSLLAPSKGARAVKVLRGTIPVYLEKETKRTVLVDNIAKAQGKKHKSDEITVEIDLFKQLAADQYQVYFSFTRNKPERQEPEWDVDGSFELEDAKGRRYEAGHSSMSGGDQRTEASIGFRPSFNNAGPLGPPVRLVYIKSVPMEYYLPFEFKDLPLP